MFAELVSHSGTVRRQTLKDEEPDSRARTNQQKEPANCGRSFAIKFPTSDQPSSPFATDPVTVFFCQIPEYFKQPVLEELASHGRLPDSDPSR